MLNLIEGNFFKICVLSQYIVYGIHFHIIHAFTYQKTLLHTLLLLVFKIVEHFPQPAIICLKLTIEILEQGVKYVDANGVVLVSLLLTLNVFYTLF